MFLKNYAMYRNCDLWVVLRRLPLKFKGLFLFDFDVLFSFMLYKTNVDNIYDILEKNVRIKADIYGLMKMLLDDTITQEDEQMLNNVIEKIMRGFKPVEDEESFYFYVSTFFFLADEKGILRINNVQELTTLDFWVATNVQRRLIEEYNSKIARAKRYG